MDNMTSLLAATNSCSIRLNHIQYAAYKQGRLDIRSPENKPLGMIGKNVSRITEDDAIYQLWYQACLLEVLFDNLQHHEKLPHKAINNITRVIDRIDAHLKKQIAV